MKKYIIFVLFVFVCTGSQAQTSDKLHELVTKLTQSKPDTARIRLSIDLAEYYHGYMMRVPTRMDSMAFYLKKAEDLNKKFRDVKLQNRINLWTAIRQYTLNSATDARDLFIPVIDTCKKTGDKLNETHAWMWLGNCVPNDSLSNSFKLMCFQNGLVSAREAGDDDMEMAMLGFIGLAHIWLNKFDIAERELLQVLKEEKRASPVVMLSINISLSYLYIAKGEYDKALNHNLRALHLMGVTGDSTSALSIYDRFSFLYQILKKPVESLEWSKKSLDYADASNITGTFDKVDAIVFSLRRLDKSQEALDFIQEQIRKRKPTEINDKRIVQRALGDVHNALRMYDLAEKHYVEMIRLGNLQNLGIDQKGLDNCQIGVFYSKRGQYNKALPFLKTSLKNYEAFGHYAHLQYVHEFLFKTDSALGDYKAAIQHLRESNRLGDSIFSIERNKKVEELQIAYQTVQKDKDFKLLTEKEKLAQVQLQNTQSTRNWIIGGAFMLLIIAGLLFRQGQSRKKNNKVINTKNTLLEHLVTEKDWLLKEIHHRVKNNLQIVMSLLNSQTAYIENESALTAIHDSQHRVHAMSLIHQKLYNTESVSLIDMSSYIRELVSYLAESFNTGQRISFEYTIEPLEMDVSEAVPLGLILNEAITNSIKYAFPDNRNGVIRISLSHTEPNHCLLNISDNGIGMPAHFTGKKAGSLGMSLMEGLSEDLEGNFSIESSNGTSIKISFVFGRALSGMAT